MATGRSRFTLCDSQIYDCVYRRVRDERTPFNHWNGEPSIHIAGYVKGREDFPIKKFNNSNITPSIHKDNLSRFIDSLLYCSRNIEGVLQMLAPHRST
jgi:hypothetical protein